MTNPDNDPVSRDAESSERSAWQALSWLAATRSLRSGALECPALRSEDSASRLTKHLPNGRALMCQSRPRGVYFFNSLRIPAQRTHFANSFATTVSRWDRATI